MTPARQVLAIDVGLGTTDILLTQPGATLENAVKLVVPSRTQVVARRIAAATLARASVVFHGPVMGGGPSTAAMKAHRAEGLRFVAGESAARTFADDLDRVRALGVEVVGDDEAAWLADEEGRQVAIRSGDLHVEGVRNALAGLGVELEAGSVAVAVQDHGFDPRGSNRVFRFALWERAVQERSRVGDLFYGGGDIPVALTRLRAAAGLAEGLGDAGAPMVAADTGPAALYGALPEDGGSRDAVLVNVGNGHVVCAIALDGRLAGVFEHHTSAVDAAGLDERLRRFLAGGLTAAAVREDGGHGAALSPEARGVDLLDLPLIATGPRRELLASSALPFAFAAPHGDMMLTGCYGLLRAVTERGLAGG